MTRPEILRAFGWRAVLVLTRDWYHEPQSVLDRIERLVRGEAEPEVELENEPIPRTEAAPAPPTPPVSGNQQVPAENPVAAGKTQRFELKEGRSSKFWEITQNDFAPFGVRWGRIDTHGQTLRKNFDNTERATRECKKLVAEKLGKGYRQCEG